MRSRSGMKPNEVAIYFEVVIDSYLRAVLDGDGKARQIAPDYSDLGRRTGMDRNNARRAVRGLIDLGYLRERDGQIWPASDRFRQLAEWGALEDGEDLTPQEVASIPDEPESDCLTPPSQIASPPSQIDSPAHIEPACACGRSIRMNSGLREENSREENSQSVYPDSLSCSAQNSNPQHTQTYDRPVFKHPPTPEEEAWVIRFCDDNFPMKALAENFLTNCRGLYPFPWIKKALKRMYLARRCGWAYVAQILREWEAMGGAPPGSEDRFDDRMNPVIEAPSDISRTFSPVAAPDRPMGQFATVRSFAAWIEGQNEAGVDWLQVEERGVYRPRGTATDLSDVANAFGMEFIEDES
jgi:hypothetical protein